jgi:methionyl-tRNA formyltransferase
MPGQVLGLGDQGVYVKCGSGAIEVLEMQKPGGKKMSAKMCLQTLSADDKLLCFQTKASL